MPTFHQVFFHEISRTKLSKTPVAEVGIEYESPQWRVWWGGGDEVKEEEIFDARQTSIFASGIRAVHLLRSKAVQFSITIPKPPPKKKKPMQNPNIIEQIRNICSLHVVKEETNISTEEIDLTIVDDALEEAENGARPTTKTRQKKTVKPEATVSARRKEYNRITTGGKKSPRKSQKASPSVPPLPKQVKLRREAEELQYAFDALRILMSAEVFENSTLSFCASLPSGRDVLFALMGGAREFGWLEEPLESFNILYGTESFRSLSYQQRKKAINNLRYFTCSSEGDGQIAQFARDVGNLKESIPHKDHLTNDDIRNAVKNISEHKSVFLDLGLPTLKWSKLSTAKQYSPPSLAYAITLKKLSHFIDVDSKEVHKAVMSVENFLESTIKKKKSV
eukprot:GHVO01049921.1.p1 GENE.GHVO01049921.1~~GHVO01049921.1.p1  ORF type:complete len:411 (-),score=81.89 GHVO01049921.1:1236-2414(-)